MDKTTFEKLLKPSEIAEILDVSLSYAYKLIDQGKLPHIQIGRSRRVEPADLKEYLQRNHSHRSFGD